MPRAEPDRVVEPTVQRLRVRYSKRGRMRFSSHRDFQRAFERALRRGDVPIAYSAGFTPHPKVSYAGAAPTGTASEAEYLEIGLARACDPADVARRLDAALPPGLDVVEVVEAGPIALADRIEASAWRLAFIGLDAGALRAAVDTFLAADAVHVERMFKDGRRVLDARAPIVQIWVPDGDADGVAGAGDRGPCAILEVVVRHTTPAVRPDDIVAGLRQAAGLVLPAPPLVTRVAQGLLGESGQLADPLAPERVADAVAHTAAGAVLPTTP